MENNKAKLIKTASIIAMAGNAVLALLKIIVGLLAGSLAVVGDGIDSSTDVIIAMMSLIVAGIIARPADAEHPWGHGRAETIATTILAFILFFAGGQLIIRSVTSIFSGAVPEAPAPLALAVTGFSILGKLSLAWSQYYFGKRADSAMLRANGKNMVGDVVISSGVLLGVGLSIMFNIGILDPIVATLVGLWVIRSSVSIFLEANMELMDGSSDTAPYTAVFNAVRTVPGTINPHRTRMRRIAGLWDIDIDIEVDPEMKVREAHHIASQVERAIKDSVEGVYDIVVHIEPAGEADKHDEEQYGLRESEL
ncbi:cation diffusion facilitator family transporter [Gracilinema caldarium]|uniref:cation diffusion facilitator family transporter n=1 Tax=Gracilinema caldarium TaxID=215591 RepID=UPI0026EBFD9E|nr:cation diffusion facilitator family transporter [Gracilinema caldarium]